LHRIARALPAAGPAPAPGDYAARDGAAKGRVALFAGCTGEALQGGTLTAALTLLRHAGYNVRVPPTAGCCGALAQHAGDRRRASRLAAHNRAVFDGEMDAVLSIASGCGIQIDGYQPPLPAAHFDICRFLLEHGGLRSDDFEPLPKTVALHTPCSVENVYRGAAWARGLLDLVPGLQVIPVGEAGQCCGAAGDHMLRRPAAAAALRRPLLDQVADCGVTLLATGNVGCAMHLAEGLSSRGLALEIVHPIEVLARQLGT
jgi:glycolate oxidase iron-sulfur subunit